MTKLPDINDPLCKEVFNKTKSEIESLSSKLKIDNLSEEFFKEIVIPLAIYFNSLKIKKDPYLIGFTGGQGSGKLLFQTLFNLFYKWVLIKQQLDFQ